MSAAEIPVTKLKVVIIFVCPEGIHLLIKIISKT